MGRVGSISIPDLLLHKSCKAPIHCAQRQKTHNNSGIVLTPVQLLRRPSHCKHCRCRPQGHDDAHHNCDDIQRRPLHTHNVHPVLGPESVCQTSHQMFPAVNLLLSKASSWSTSGVHISSCFACVQAGRHDAITYVPCSTSIKKKPSGPAHMQCCIQQRSTPPQGVSQLECKGMSHIPV